MTNRSDWKTSFRHHDHIGLALDLRESGKARERPVRVLADDRVLLVGGAVEAARLSKRPARKKDQPVECVVVTPEESQSSEEFEQRLHSLRGEYKTAEIAGFGPRGWSDDDGLLDRQVIKVGQAGWKFEEAEGWREQARLASSALTLVLVYTPEVTPDALEEAARILSGVEGLESVVVLPLGAGDRIPLPGLTTSGAVDMMVLSALRYLLGSEVRIRASWAALGWKVAQLALQYGADELGGWTAAETLAYSGRVRAAARVENDEVESGLSEVGRRREPWRGEAAEVTR